MAHKNTSLLISKTKFADTKIVEQTLPSLQANQVLLEVEKFGFTANNITYALFGEELGYWHFFPTKTDWGIIPVWGIGKVLASEQATISVGQRYYGYFPMASHCIVEAGKIQKPHFVDIAAHRNALPVIYNTYMDAEAAFGGANEDIQLLFRPLFTTSFLLDDFLASKSFFNAEQLILTSASSKTAMGLATLLKARKQSEKQQQQIIGLTSARNEEFVRNLGYYDQVFTYEHLAQLPLAPTCVIDFSGNESLLHRLQDQLQDHLTYNCLVGASHWDKRSSASNNPIKGTFFFAPTYAQERVKEWGMLAFQTRLQKAWKTFDAANKKALDIQNIQTMGAIQQTYLKALAGNIAPKTALIMSP